MSRGSAGEYDADEQAGVARLRWRAQRVRRDWGTNWTELMVYGTLKSKYKNDSNPHMKKNIDLRECEMLMCLTSKRLSLNITTSNTAESGNCGSSFLPQESLISPYSLRAPFTWIARASLGFWSACFYESQSDQVYQITQKYLKYLSQGHIAYPRLTLAIVCLIMCALLLSHVRFCDPMDCSPPGCSVPGITGKNTGVDCHFLLQGTQGLN